MSDSHDVTDPLESHPRGDHICPACQEYDCGTGNLNVLWDHPEADFECRTRKLLVENRHLRAAEAVCEAAADMRQAWQDDNDPSGERATADLLAALAKWEATRG